MSTPVYDKHGISVYQGDCLEIMRSLPDASVHAIVTDLLDLADDGEAS